MAIVVNVPADPVVEYASANWPDPPVPPPPTPVPDTRTNAENVTDM